MRQYCSGGSSTWSSIQPLWGVWSSGWLRKKAKRPPGASTRADLGDGVVDALDVLEHEARHDGVEGGVAERQVGRACPGVGRTAGALVGFEHLGPGGVDPHDGGGASGDREPGDLSLAAPHVEHPVGPGEPLRRQGQDLLLVLGVGAPGEAVLPPRGVGLPQVAGSGGQVVGQRRVHTPDGGRRAGRAPTEWILPCTASATVSGNQDRARRSSMLASFTASSRRAPSRGASCGWARARGRRRAPTWSCACRAAAGGR